MSKCLCYMVFPTLLRIRQTAAASRGTATRHHDDRSRALIVRGTVAGVVISSTTGCADASSPDSPMRCWSEIDSVDLRLIPPRQGISALQVTSRPAESVYTGQLAQAESNQTPNAHFTSVLYVSSPCASTHFADCLVSLQGVGMAASASQASRNRPCRGPASQNDCRLTRYRKLLETRSVRTAHLTLSLAIRHESTNPRLAERPATPPENG